MAEMEPRKEHEQEQLEDLELSDDQADEVAGGEYLKITMTTATLSGTNSPPPQQN